MGMSHYCHPQFLPSNRTAVYDNNNHRVILLVRQGLFFQWYDMPGTGMQLNRLLWSRPLPVLLRGLKKAVGTIVGVGQELQESPGGKEISSG